jgi:hypothetical protein
VLKLIKKVRIEEKVRYWDMSIPKTHNYVLGNGAVVHNTGVGFSVQKHHVENLPEITKPNHNRRRRFLIGDSIEGWADSIKVLMKSYFFGGSAIDFDFRDIRPKGARLVTSGGKAPGPQPLKECLVKIEGLLSQKENGDKLKPIEVHDIVCYIADAVLAGGIRRAALISLFSADDDEMISAKTGSWWELNPQRGRANNSAVLLRNIITREFFMDMWAKIEASGSGEPGIYFSNDKDWGTNPCCLSGDTLIQTKNGEIPIRELVNLHKKTGSCPKVWTYDEKTATRELMSIEAADLTRQNAELIKLELENGSIIKLTPDHQVYTKNRGYVEAAKLTEDDELLMW